MDSASTDPVLIHHFKGHADTVLGLAFNPVDDRVISCSADKKVLLWQNKESARAIQFSNHSNAINDITWSADGNLFATASSDTTVRFWTPKITGVTVSSKAHSLPVRSVDFDGKCDKYLTASDDKTIKLWSFRNKKILKTYSEHKNWVKSARFSPFTGDRMASCSDDKTTKVFNLETGVCEHTFHDNKACATKVVWHPQNIVATAYTDGKIKLFDLTSNSLIQVYKTHKGPVNSLAFHPNGRYLLTGGDDGDIKVLDITIARPIYTLCLHNGPVTAVAFSKCGDRFASGGADKYVKICKTNFDVEESQEWSLMSGGSFDRNENTDPNLGGGRHTTVKTENDSLWAEKVEIDKAEPNHSEVDPSCTTTQLSHFYQEICQRIDPIFGQLEIMRALISTLDFRVSAIENRIKKK